MKAYTITSTNADNVTGDQLTPLLCGIVKGVMYLPDNLALIEEMKGKPVVIAITVYNDFAEYRKAHGVHAEAQDYSQTDAARDTGSAACQLAGHSDGADDSAAPTGDHEDCTAVCC